jgi:hypothetical protein
MKHETVGYCIGTYIINWQSLSTYIEQTILYLSRLELLKKLFANTFSYESMTYFELPPWCELTDLSANIHA